MGMFLNKNVPRSVPIGVKHVVRNEKLKIFFLEAPLCSKIPETVTPSGSLCKRIASVVRIPILAFASKPTAIISPSVIECKENPIIDVKPRCLEHLSS